MSDRSPGGTISLRGTSPGMNVDFEHVYFAFPSGGLTYDCVACGAKCCRGFGFRIEDRVQLQRRVTSQPAFGMFVERTHGSDDTTLLVTNCPPACFFLDEQNRCGVHAEQGFDAKPETCRLFPFNNFMRFGEYVVVLPHAGLCPLAVVSRGQTATTSTHSGLFAAMAASGVSAPMPRSRRRPTEAARTIHLERRIVRLLSDRVPSSYEDFAAAQLTLTRGEMSRRTQGDAPTDEFEAAKATVSRYLHTLFGVLGRVPCAEDSTNPALVSTLLACTPIFRARLLFGEAKGPSYPVADPELVPRAMLALHTIAAFALESGMREITYQTLDRLFKAFAPLLVLLAYLDSPVQLRPQANIKLAFPGDRASCVRYLKILVALVPASRANRVNLGDVLCSNLDFDVVDRICFLKDLARQLVPDIESVNAPHSRMPLLATAQRWVLRHGSVDALLALSARQARRTRKAH